MAAQARYDKNIPYTSRQIDEKYLQKNHRHRESSPYNFKAHNYQSSPNRRKRTYDSPSSSSSKHSNSPYEQVRKKERLVNSSSKVPKEISPVDGEWSQHVSSSGKIYYYNKRTEESQWELPKEWNERKDKEQLKNNHISRDDPIEKYIRDERSSNKDIRELKSVKIPPDKLPNRDNRDSETKFYRDSRGTRDFRDRDHDSRDSFSNDDRDRSNRDRDRVSRDRDYREYYGSRDYLNGKSRMSTNSSTNRDYKYTTNSIKTIGQSTPTSITSLNRSYRNTPDILNGDNLQDISPPGTPTNDDVVNISGISPAPIYTPQRCSPLLNNSLSNSVLQLSTATPRTPLLSPIVIKTNSQLPTPFLHPLQQAFLLQQQVPVLLSGSPKLPTVKNHLSDTGSASSSPKLLSPFQFKSQSSPASSFRNSNGSTPPPPPPPPKEQIHQSDNRTGDRGSSKADRYHRSSSSYETRPDTYLSRDHSSSLRDRDRDHREHSSSLRDRDRDRDHPSRDYSSRDSTLSREQGSYDSLSRSKSFDERTIETPKSQRTNDVRSSTDRQSKKIRNTDDEVIFVDLPNLERYTTDYSTNIIDFTAGFYGNTLEKQISTQWEETMGILHGEGYRTKFNYLMSKHESELHESKFDVASNWSEALNTVLLRLEGLQDSSMKSEIRTPRDHKSSPSQRRNRLDTSILNNENKENGVHENTTDNVRSINSSETKQNTTATSLQTKPS